MGIYQAREEVFAKWIPACAGMTGAAGITGATGTRDAAGMTAIIKQSP